MKSFLNTALNSTENHSHNTHLKCSLALLNFHMQDSREGGCSLRIPNKRCARHGNNSAHDSKIKLTEQEHYLYNDITSQNYFICQARHRT